MKAFHALQKIAAAVIGGAIVLALIAWVVDQFCGCLS